MKTLGFLILDGDFLFSAVALDRIIDYCWLKAGEPATGKDDDGLISI